MIVVIWVLKVLIWVEVGVILGVVVLWLIGVSKGLKVQVDWVDLIGCVVFGGDWEVFKWLFEYFVFCIKGFMFKVGCSGDEVEEIVQSIMIVVWCKVY